jgi:TolB-like protein/outer membrane protein assembly factor BamB
VLQKVDLRTLGNTANDPVVRPKGATRRVAVLDFSNLTGNKSFDHYTMGIPEVIRAELSSVRGLTLLDATGAQEPTPRDAGKAMQADVVVSGSLQHENNRFMLLAKVVEVESGQQVSAVEIIEKPHQGLFALQGEVAQQLATKLQANLTPAEIQDLEATATGTHNPRAFQNFSDGVFYLRQNMLENALKSFTASIAEGPNFPGAQYYRAETLEKMQRTDEAIEALKIALPGAEKDHPLLWHWNFQPGGKHGVIGAFDTAHQQMQHTLFRNETMKDFRRQVVYAEAVDNGTILHFVDPLRHTEQTQKVNDSHILFNTGFDRAYSDGSTTIVTSFTQSVDGTASSTLYAFAGDGSRKWQWTIPPEAAKDLPLAGLLGNSFVVAMPRIHRIDVIDVPSGKVRWSDPNIAIEAVEFPLSARTQKYGDIVMFKSNDTYRAVKLKDGTDAWTVRGIQSSKVSQLINGKHLIIFEPERRILTVDVETGKVVQDIPLLQFADNAPLNFVTSISLVGALVENDILYVLSKDLQLCAINLRAYGPDAILWKTPLPSRFWSIAVHGNKVYLTTENNQLVVLDARGKIVRQSEIPAMAMVRYVTDDYIVMSTSLPTELFALSATTDQKLWEYPRVDLELPRNDNVIVSYSSASQLNAVDTSTGEVLWKHVGVPIPWVYVSDNRVFVLDRDGVNEYSTGKREESISDRQVFTALARLYLEKGDLDQATALAAKAEELDPDYPALVLVRARIDQAQRKMELAGVELARYANLVGVNSAEGQQALREMSRNYRLQWQAEIDMNVVGTPAVKREPSRRCGTPHFAQAAPARIGFENGPHRVALCRRSLRGFRSWRRSRQPDALVCRG